MIANQKREEEKGFFYKLIENTLYSRMDCYTIQELMDLLMKEKDPVFVEIESEALSHKLVSYIGPVSIEQLEQLLNVFPVASTWRLASEAVHPFIRKYARKKVEEILDMYGYEKEEPKIRRKRK